MNSQEHCQKRHQTTGHDNNCKHLKLFGDEENDVNHSSIKNASNDILHHRNNASNNTKHSIIKSASHCNKHSNIKNASGQFTCSDYLHEFLIDLNNYGILLLKDVKPSCDNKYCVKMWKSICKLEYTNYIELLFVAATLGREYVFLQLKSRMSQMFNKMIDNSHTGYRLLCAACEGGSLTIIKTIIMCGVNVNFKYKCCPEKVWFSMNINVNVVTNDEEMLESPLLCSTSPEVSQYLLFQGIKLCNKSSLDRNLNIGDIALRRAVTLNSMDLLNVLVEYGVPVNVSSVIFAFRRSNYDSLTNSICEDILTMKFILLNKLKAAEINTLDCTGCSLLIEAVEKHDDRLVTTLAEKGADMNITDSRSFTPLTTAAQAGDVAMVHLLHRHGADLDHKDTNERTALMVAAKNNQFATFSSLIDAGADVNIERYGHTLLSIFLSENSGEPQLRFIKYLLQNNGRVSLSESKPSLYKIHQCIPWQEYDLLFILICHGNFPPSVIETHTRFCMTKKYIVDGFRGVLSPLCMALLCGQADLAREFIKTLYLTTSDLTLLPTHQGLRSHLELMKCYKCLNIVHDLSGPSPPPLLRLSFTTVSSLIGSQPGRKDRIQGLGVPGALQAALSYRSWADRGSDAAEDEEDDDDDDNAVYTPEFSSEIKGGRFSPVITRWGSYHMWVPGPLF